MRKLRLVIAAVAAVLTVAVFTPGSASAGVYAAAAPHAPSGYHVVYANNFINQGMKNWTPVSGASAQVLLSTKPGAEYGMGIKITKPGQKTWMVYTPKNPYFIGPNSFIQALIFIPRTAGGQVANWPALWTTGDPWPNNGEIDMLEGLDGQACVHTHYGTVSDEAGPSGGCAKLPLGTDWLTVSMLRTGGMVKVWYDGTYIGEAPLPTSAEEELIFSDQTTYCSGCYGPFAADTAWLSRVTVWEK